MDDKVKVITMYNGVKHLATFNQRSNRWFILGSGRNVPDAQVVKIEEAMQ